MERQESSGVGRMLGFRGVEEEVVEFTGDEMLLEW